MEKVSSFLNHDDDDEGDDGDDGDERVFLFSNTKGEMWSASMNTNRHF